MEVGRIEPPVVPAELAMLRALEQRVAALEAALAAPPETDEMLAKRVERVMADVTRRAARLRASGARTFLDQA